MKNTLQRQGVMLVLTLLVSVCAMACGPGESSAKKRGQQPATGEATQAAKPGGIAKTSEVPKPVDVDTVDLGGGVKMELVWVPAGSFQMGSPDSGVGREPDEGPVHTVELDGFWMGMYEVTQEQYEAVTGTNPSNFFKREKNPVETVSWNDAADFCRKVTDKVGRASSPARTFRLPTEAEWEYACRAGSTTRFCFGDSDSGLGDYAWYNGNSGNQTHPVGAKKPNAWGLYDMHGNVWEWCGDWYADKYDSGATKNPQGASSGEYRGEYRVLRGGTSGSYPFDCRSASRLGYDLSIATVSVGFRVVCGGFSSR
jgi:formylglycine-generating enzyme required for sulfatase activity